MFQDLGHALLAKCVSALDDQRQSFLFVELLEANLTEENALFDLGLIL